MEAGTPWGLSKSFAERGENWAGPGEKEKSHFQEKEIVVSLRAVGPSWKVEGTLGAWAVGVARPGREGPGGGGHVRIGMEKHSGLLVWGCAFTPRRWPGRRAQAFPLAVCVELALTSLAFPEFEGQSSVLLGHGVSAGEEESSKGKPSRGKKGADGVPGRAQASRATWAAGGAGGPGC